jgi:hypothetical protein
MFAGDKILEKEALDFTDERKFGNNFLFHSRIKIFLAISKKGLNCAFQLV